MKKKTYSWMSPLVKIKETKKYGKGVFAKHDINKDTILFVMGGYILDINDENKLVKEGGIASDKPIEISDCFSISPIDEESLKMMPQHYINHSCDPNCGWNGQLFLVSMRNIKKDEEITYDYAMIMCSNPNSDSYFTMKCKCDSSKCRRIISENDWMDPKIQKRYDGYFQWFIQKNIDKLKRKRKLKK